MEGCRIGIDTHADSSCAGRHVRILEYIDGKEYSVIPFHNDYKPMQNIKMINGIVAVDTDDGNSYILELNHFLDFTNSMENTILVPMQARINGVTIDDVPKTLCPHNMLSESIYFIDEDIRIPIEYHGPIPHVKSRYPTDDDMETHQWLSLTSKHGWDPYPEEVSSIRSNANNSNKNLYESLCSSAMVRSVNRKKGRNTMNVESLSKLWNISLKAAKRTLHSTTHSAIRTKEGFLTRRYRTDLYQRRYNVLGGGFSQFYTDTLYFKVKSISQETCAQIYANKSGFTKMYPMETKSQAHNTLSNFVHEVGIPHELHSDNAKELISGEMRKKLNKYEIYYTSTTDPYTPKQNYAEDTIRIVKTWARHFMQISNTPIRLFMYALLYVCDLRNLTASSYPSANNRTQFELTFGYSPNISEYVSFKWFQIVWYWNPTDIQKQQLGRWLGVAKNIGSGHSYLILSVTGEVLARSTVTSLVDEELQNPRVKASISSFDLNIEKLLGNYTNAVVNGESIDSGHVDTDFIIEDEEQTSMYDDNIDFQELLSKESSDLFEMPESDNRKYNETLASELNDLYIGTQMTLPYNGESKLARIESRKRTIDGKMLIGRQHNNPIIDSRVYIAEFDDGGIAEYSTNILAEAIYSNIDEEGSPYAMIDGILSHRRSNEAIEKLNGYIENNGIRRRVITTKGWDLLVSWKDGSRSWLPLKDVKESNPIDVAEYSISRDINSEPAFAWWVPGVMRKRERIISKIKANKSVRRSVKFGIEVPTLLKHAKELDRINENDLWEKAIRKELDKVRVAFELLPEEGIIPIGTKKINYHFVFDVKMDLTRKARLVAGGHLNRNVPKHTTYSSVVSRESVRLCFMIAALHDLDILAGDVGNAYLNALPRERCYVIIEDEWLFGPSAIGRIALIVRALYGMKSSGAAWRDTISSVLHFKMGFTQCLADNEVWFKENYSETLGRYYSYICLYVDDILIISHRPKYYMDQIGEEFLISKPDSIGPPDRYLGSDIRKKILPDGNTLWITGANSYLKEAIRVINAEKVKYGFKTQGRGVQPFSNIQYRPELDVTPQCDDKMINFYQHTIGMLRWLIELGTRLDILLETSLLSSYLAAPRIGHLEQALHIFYYLQKHENSWLAMDPHKINISWNGAPDQAPERRRTMMQTIYRDAIEDLPDNAPEALGKPIQLNVYSDADHAGNKVTRRSQTGILIYANMAPMIWFSKRQNTVESSTFGSEFIALRIATEKVKSFRYKLRMMGLKLDGPTNVFVDNESVVNSSMRPESVLKKKHVSIAYNLARESFAASIITVFGIPSEENLSDGFTKVLPIHKRKTIFGAIFW